MVPKSDVWTEGSGDLEKKPRKLRKKVRTGVFGAVGAAGGAGRRRLLLLVSGLRWFSDIRPWSRSLGVLSRTLQAG